MIAEFGHFALINAFILSLAQSVLPLFIAARRNIALMLVAPAAAISHACSHSLIFCLVWGFISDFSLSLVANHSIPLPMIYKISAHGAIMKAHFCCGF